MIQDLLAQPPLHAYLSPCHPGLCTLAFVSIVLDGRTQTRLLQGSTKWSKGQCVYHLSPPFSPLFCSLPSSLNDKPLFFTPPPLLASLCLSLTPQFLILHIFPFPVLPQHSLSHSPLLSILLSCSELLRISSQLHS